MPRRGGRAWLCRALPVSFKLAVMIDLNGIRLRNRVVTSASLAGYGARPESRLFPYGLSPIAQFLPLERLGAVTTRTLTLEPREGQFTTRTDWRAREWPELPRPYAGARG